MPASDPRRVRGRSTIAGRGQGVWLWVSLLVVGLGVAAPRIVYARREGTFAYPYSRVWTAAVRLMRVDYACDITEKDKDDGYFLFEYPDRGKLYSGSVELIADKDKDDGGSVRVVLTIPTLPSYVESMMMERLGRKLEQEFGPPKEIKRPVEAPRPPEDPDNPSDPDKPKTPPAKPPPNTEDRP
jgi:hypothetical protein